MEKTIMKSKHCYNCKEELNMLDLAFCEHFTEFKDGVKILLCSKCGQKKVLLNELIRQANEISELKKKLATKQQKEK